MANFLISYDLTKPEKDYPKLLAELQNQNCVRVLKSQWVGTFNNTAKEVGDHFVKFMDRDDRILVSPMPRGGYAYRTTLADNTLANLS